MAADGRTGLPWFSARTDDKELDDEAIVREIDATLERIHISIQEQNAAMDDLLKRLSRPAR